ncbi:aminotransferase class V-fold PLP-dependent enzyme, partial [Intestinibacter bartlettii]
GNHIITSKIEHHAILHTCEYLEKVHGFEVTYLDVDADGKVDLEQLKRVISDNTILVSVMFANNEIGTIQPIKEITEIAHAHGALMHTDGVQACGNIPVDVKELGVDLMSMSGHKIYGPKGIGALYIKKGVKIHNFMHGGAQERKKRAGTENVPAIVGYGKAAEMAKNNMENHVRELTRLRDKLMYGLQERIPHTRINGHKTDRLPGTANVSFQFIEGEGILLLLDQAGIAGSSGSACTSGSLDPSHVLMALGLPHELAHGSLRLVVGDFTTEEDIDYVLETLPPIIARLRELSPLYQTYIKEHPEENK